MTPALRLPHLALSIKQPWAQLILLGRKSIEVRSWTTAFRGRIWVHTGRRLDEAAQLLFRIEGPLFLGGYLGIADIVSIEPFTRETWSRFRDRHLVPGALTPGHYAWRLERPTLLREPVPGPGQVGLFNVPEALLQKLQTQL
jgi:ASCH domain